MKVIISSDDLHSDSIKKIELWSGQRLSLCYQCGECTAGCPLREWMDLAPHQIIRFLQLGMLKEPLSSKTIWLCASCETCTTRCPKGVDLAKLMDAIRKLAQKTKIISPEKGVHRAQKIFLENIRRFGRQFEAGLAGEYNFRSGQPFKDLTMGAQLFLKGKLKPLPSRNKNLKEIQEIFRKVEEVEKEYVTMESPRERSDE